MMDPLNAAFNEHIAELQLSQRIMGDDRHLAIWVKARELSGLPATLQDWLDYRKEVHLEDIPMEATYEWQVQNAHRWPYADRAILISRLHFRWWIRHGKH